jgi:hypothetical protein
MSLRNSRRARDAPVSTALGGAVSAVVNGGAELGWTL